MISIVIATHVSFSLVNCQQKQDKYHCDSLLSSFSLERRKFLDLRDTNEC